MNLERSNGESWPFVEARKVVARMSQRQVPLVFETGYGPSGLPHIGTFGEVVRTSWVRRAFNELTGHQSRLIVFSDDMDAMREVPDNVPQGEMLKTYIGFPLSRVPDPFGTHHSFAAHNNAALRSFLDDLQIDYEFCSATDMYLSGHFDALLLAVLQEHDNIAGIVASTLRAERASTYSPFMPIHPRTGKVMQVKLDEVDPISGIVRWTDPDTLERFESLVTGGGCKLQWKVDWAMRWHALGVDYEMSGKDLLESVRLSSKIVRIIGGAPPISFTYELFLDENGEKISKSRGNGVSVDEWLASAPIESLARVMYSKPQTAKRLYRSMIPSVCDEFLTESIALTTMNEQQARNNPAWHVIAGRNPQEVVCPVTFSLLINLADATDASDVETLDAFLKAGGHEINLTNPFIRRLLECAVSHNKNVLRPTRRFRIPEGFEITALEELESELRSLSLDQDGESIQALIYEVGKHYPFNNLREWFACLYSVLLGRESGPRFGHFVALYGVVRTADMIRRILDSLISTASF
jgi:lysyl-tRNA synthetase, class I